MPPVIGLIIGLAIVGAGAGAAIAAGTIAATLLGISALTLILTGATLIVGGVVGMLNRPPSVSSLVNDAANHAVSIRQPAAPRVIIRGRSQLGGIVTFICSSGSNAEYLHLVVTWAGHECDAIEEYWFDNYKLTLDGSGNETGKYAGVVKVETKLGAPGESAFAGLIADAPTAWTSAHKQEGCCSTHFRLKWDANKFPNGAPSAIRATIRGKKVFDPRDSSTAWSQNLALHIRDHMTDRKYGLRAQSWELDDASFIAAANLCDEAVELAAGGSEARYTCNGFYDTSKTVGDVLSGLLSSGFGKMPWVGGQWKIFLGAWRTPTAPTLTDDDFRGPLTLTGRIGRRDSFNGVKGVFLYPGNAWSSSDFPPVVRASYVADDNGITGTTDKGNWALTTVYGALDAAMHMGYAYVCTAPHTADADKEPGLGAHWEDYWQDAGEISWKDVEYPFTTSPATSQRLAKMELEAGRRPITLAAACKLGPYLSSPPDVVPVTHANFGWTDKTFELASAMLTVESDMALGVNFSMRETDEDVYAWSTADEQPMLDAPTPVLNDPDTVQSVTDLTIESGPADAVTAPDGVTRARIHAFWNSPADQFVIEGGKIFVEFKKHADSTWIVQPEYAGDVQDAWIDAVEGGTYYDVRVRPRNVYGVYGAYAEADNLQASTTISSIVQESLSPTTIGNKNSTIVGGTNPLSATDAGSSATIAIAAFALQFGFGQVSFNSGSITGLAYSTGYYVFFDDSSVPPAGGPQTYQASTDFTDVLAGRHRYYVGWINTPAMGGGGTGGGGNGGGCCCVGMFLEEGRTVGDIRNGEFADCFNGRELERQSLEMGFSSKRVRCVRLEYDNGTVWEGSADTPFHSKEGMETTAEGMDGCWGLTVLDEEWPVRRRLEWSYVRVLFLGLCEVRMLYFGHREFAAGKDPHKRAISHNSMIGGNPK
ncbi:hypothetical protein Acid345_3156 [Candidatus Koribacter versatilis Ellin345]|uniref:Tip attachment protein J domain-containing protein n=1 Tax=Koribacter versatilis (strain Ellin345) TaxID=204669 RepID=Q1ILU3_KORVE|nr:hypothetical protein [Candidatus Koribacter versatilis]ABF42157.1 hypothetical protein Acid345_3156 [Candidatus Koribacter versatilis Ellin345]